MRANTQAKPRPPVRVRYLPPTLEEAVFAAQGLTDDVEQQAEIAAMLMGVTQDEAAELVRKAQQTSQKRSDRPKEVTFSVDRSGAHRAVMVERKPNFAQFRKPSSPKVEHVGGGSVGGGATVERKPFRGLGGGQPRTLIRLGGSPRR